MFDEIYKNENRLSGRDHNFDFKVTIFYDKCRQVGLLSNDYNYDASIMLCRQAQMYYYGNRGDISIFDQFYSNMQLFFKGSK